MTTASLLLLPSAALHPFDGQVHAHTSCREAHPLLLVHVHPRVVSFHQRRVHALGLEILRVLLAFLQLRRLIRGEFAADVLLDGRWVGKEGGGSRGQLTQDAAVERAGVMGVGVSGHGGADGMNGRGRVVGRCRWRW